MKEGAPKTILDMLMASSLLYPPRQGSGSRFVATEKITKDLRRGISKVQRPEVVPRCRQNLTSSRMAGDQKSGALPVLIAARLSHRSSSSKALSGTLSSPVDASLRRLFVVCRLMRARLCQWARACLGLSKASH